jgi:hypothetical protein
MHAAMHDLAKGRFNLPLVRASNEGTRCQVTPSNVKPVHLPLQRQTTRRPWKFTCNTCLNSQPSCLA